MSNPTSSATSTNMRSKRRDLEDLDDSQLVQPSVKRGRFQNGESPLPARANWPNKRRDRKDFDDSQLGQPPIKRGRFHYHASALPARVNRPNKRRERDELADPSGQPQNKRARLMEPRIEQLEQHPQQGIAQLEMNAVAAPASIMESPSQDPSTLPQPEPQRRVHFSESIVTSEHTYPKLSRREARKLFWSKKDFKRMEREDEKESRQREIDARRREQSQPEPDAANETDGIEGYPEDGVTRNRTSNHRNNANNQKKRIMKELESSLDGVYWNSVISTGRMVTRSQSRKMALA